MADIFVKPKILRYFKKFLKIKFLVRFQFFSKISFDFYQIDTVFTFVKKI